MKVDHQQLIEKFCRCVPDFASLKLPDQRCLAEMFWRSISQSGDQEAGGRMSGAQIKEIWGSVARMQAVVKHKYFSCEPGSNLTGRSSLYTPCPEMLSAYKCLVRQGATKPLTSKVRRIPSHAHVVSSKTKSGSRRHGSGHPAAWLPIRTDLLLRFLDKSSVEALRIQASRLLYLSDAYGRSGCVPMRYTEVGPGRIFDSHGIQSLNKDIRKVALSGCYNYDISNCHLAVLRELTNGRLQLSALNEYLRHKSEIRRSIASAMNPSLANVGQDQIKQVKLGIISLAYGGVLSTSAQVHLAKTIPEESARRGFVSHPFVRALKDDLRLASRDIVEHYATADGWVENAFGIRKQFDLRREFKSAVSHIIIGYESLALDAVLQRWGEKVILPMHDGWIMQDRIPTEEFEEEIFRKIGFRLSVEVEKLQDPLDSSHDCAPNSMSEKNIADQRLAENLGQPVKTNARSPVGGVVALSSSPLCSCPSVACGGGWEGLGGVGGLVVSPRPRWNLPPTFGGVYVRVGRRPKD